MLEKLRPIFHHCVQQHSQDLHTLAEAWKEIDISPFLPFIERIRHLKSKSGHMWWTGIGKSARVGEHLSDMFRSIGYPSSPLDPIRSFHGDMGGIQEHDLVIALSKSGETVELVQLFTYLSSQPRWHQVGKLSVSVVRTDGQECSLAQVSDHHVYLPPVTELGSFHLLPTTSVLNFITWGNMILTTLVDMEKLSLEQYGMSHPSGSIGAHTQRHLVKECMVPLTQVAVGHVHESIQDIVLRMCHYRSGCALLVSMEDFHATNPHSKKLVGFVTDGDIRRSLGKTNLTFAVENIMNISPITVNPEQSLSQLQDMWEQHHHLQSVPVITTDGIVCGLLHRHV